MVMKQCKKCGQLKDLTEFYKNSRMVDGHLNICKMCVKDAGKENCELPPAKAGGFLDQRRALVRRFSLSVDLGRSDPICFTPNRRIF